MKYNKLKLLATSKRQINSAIRHLGLEIQNNRDGYSYFTDLCDGCQVGESVYICYLSQQTVGDWVIDAEIAKAQGPS